MVFTGDKPINYLLVLDFEANCVQEGAPPLKLQEIIEFPVVVVNVLDKKIADIFHSYVRPQAEPQLTAFCTELTGIKQEMVDKGVILSDCLAQLAAFLTAKVCVHLLSRPFLWTKPSFLPAAIGTSTPALRRKPRAKN